MKPQLTAKQKERKALVLDGTREPLLEPASCPVPLDVPICEMKKSLFVSPVGVSTCAFYCRRRANAKLAAGPTLPAIMTNHAPTAGSS